MIINLGGAGKHLPQIRQIFSNILANLSILVQLNDAAQIKTMPKL